MNCNDEVIIKIIGKVSLEYSDIDQIKLRGLLEEVLYKYDVLSQETALVASDIEDRIALYLAVKKLDGRSNLTIKSYQEHLLKFANFIRKPIGTITTMDIRMYLAAISKDMKPSSMATEISILKSFFGWLEQEEIIPKNPAKKINQPKVEKRLRHSLNVEELETLKESCKTLRERALIEFFYSTGARLDEVVKLNRDSIDWQTMTIRVIGKGNKERIVYISPKAKIHILKYLASRKDECPALFVTERSPHQRLGRRSIEREINKIGERAGFTKSIFPHLIRHTTATLLLNNGADLVTVQKILGHENADTTLIYAEASDEHVQSEYKKHLIQ